MPELKTQLAAYLEHAVDHPSLEDVVVGVRVDGQHRTQRVPSRRPRWVLTAAAAGALAVLTIAALLVLRSGESDPVSTVPTYEAVFLRLEVIDETRTVVVVGVNAEGEERTIARLAEAWVTYAIDGGQGFLAPMGAISTSGLLAIAIEDRFGVQWSIYDLSQLEAEPMVIPGLLDQMQQLQLTPYFSLDMARPSVFWGPGDQLAIPWYIDMGPMGIDYQLTFVDGRTGTVETAEVPEDRKVLPAWSADVFGVLLSDATSGVGNPTSKVPVEVLQPDGTRSEVSSTEMETACRTRSGPGAPVSISDGSVVSSDGSREPVELPTGVSFVCFSPDDAGLVIVYDIGTGVVPAYDPLGALFIDGAWLEVKGTFAGWIEVAG